MPRRDARTPADLIRTAGLPAAAAVAIGLAGSTAAQQDHGAGASGAPARVSMPDQPGAAGAGQPPAQSGGDKPAVTVSEHMTVDLHVKDEDLSSVLEMLAMQSQKNIITSKGVSGRVTASLYGVTFTEALDNILHPNGFGYIEQGNFIHVYTIEELVKIQESLKKRIAKVVYLNYINAEDAKNLVDPLRSERGEVRVPKKTDAFVIPAAAPAGKDDNALATCIVVIDYEDNVAAVEKLIAELDTRPAQVLVEATVLQVSLTESNAFGVDFSIIGDLNFTDFLNTGGPRSVADALTAGGTGAAGQGVSPADNQGTGISSLPGNTLNGPASFKVGVIADDISIFLRALDEVTDTTIISNPKVLALNRQPSRVLVGRRVGYLKTTSSETSTVTEPDFLDTGTQLHFRPFVAKDGAIRMELKPQISEAIIREASDAAGSVQTIPDLVTQEIVTNVIVRDGQSIVLGGLFRESTTLTRRQVPMLGDIPLVGAAFRGNDDTTQRSEIVFVITPSIVTDAAAADSANKVFDDAERVRAGNRQGLLMWSREKMTAALNVEAEQLAREGEYEKAMWKLNRSLSLNPGQPEAYRLRERITGEKEAWPSRSMLDYMVGKEINSRLQEVPPAPGKIKTPNPYGSHELPKRSVKNPRPFPLSDATSGPSAGTSGPKTGFNAANDPANQSVSRGHTASDPTAVPTAASAAALEAQQLNLTATLTPSQTPPELDATTATINGHTPRPQPVDDPQTAADRARTQSLLTTLRSQIELFTAANNGQFPLLGSGEASGWQPLIDQRFLRTPPTNPWIHGPNASRVVLGRGPDSEFHTDYGWIYNPQTGQLWAAATDDEGRALPHADFPQDQNQNTQPAVTEAPETGEHADASSLNPDAPTPNDAHVTGGPAFAGDAPATDSTVAFSDSADSAHQAAPVALAPVAPRSRGFFRSWTRSFFSPFRSTVPVPPGLPESETATAPGNEEESH